MLEDVGVRDSFPTFPVKSFREWGSDCGALEGISDSGVGSDSFV